MHRAYKRAFIAGATVTGDLTENWHQAADVRIDAIPTGYPLELRATISKNPSRR